MNNINNSQFSHIIGPRVVGGHYHCGYWNLEYTVTKIEGTWLTCDWADGKTTRHCTAWDENKDRVLSAHPPWWHDGMSI